MDQIYKAWKKETLRSRYLSAALVFPRDLDTGSVKSQKSRLSVAKKFEKSLVGLCNAFDFDVETAETDCSLDGFPFSESRLEMWFARDLELLFVKARSFRLGLEKDLEQGIDRERRTPGPERIPVAWAEQILVGIEAIRAPSGQKQLRDFLTKEGELHRFFKRRGIGDDRSSLVLTPRSRDELSLWRSTKKQRLERSILSSILGRDVKKLSSCPALVDLRMRIKKRAEHLEAKASAK